VDILDDMGVSKLYKDVDPGTCCTWWNQVHRSEPDPIIAITVAF